MGFQTKEKARAYQKKYRRLYPEKYQAKDRKDHLKKEYGLSLEDFDRMVRDQAGLCAICGQPPVANRKMKTARLVVDQNHADGRVRGLLCHGCNLGLGHMNTPEKALAAMRYLQERGW